MILWNSEEGSFMFQQWTISTNIEIVHTVHLWPGNGERRHSVRILIQNELLEQVDTFPYLWSLITDDSECTAEFRTRLNKGQAIGASRSQKIWKIHSIRISTKIRLMKALVWPAATYGCESWTLRKIEETLLDWERFCGFCKQQRKERVGS